MVGGAGIPKMRMRCRLLIMNFELGGARSSIGTGTGYRVRVPGTCIIILLHVLLFVLCVCV